METTLSATPRGLSCGACLLGAAVAIALAAPPAVAQEMAFDGMHSTDVSSVGSCADTLLPANLTRLTVSQQAVLTDTTQAVVAQVDLVSQTIASAARLMLGRAGASVPNADSLGIWVYNVRHLPFVIVLHRARPATWRIDTAPPVSATSGAKLSALYAAVLRSIPSDSLWMAWPDDYASDSVAFRLDLAPYDEQPLIPTTKTSRFAVFNTKALYEKPALLKPDQSPPSYPGDALQRHIVGAVLLQFVIDRDGRADSTTIKVLRPTAETLRTSPFAHYYDEFDKEVEKAVERYQYAPAVVGSCAVRELVQAPFNFITPQR